MYRLAAAAGLASVACGAAIDIEAFSNSRLPSGAIKIVLQTCTRG
jgi:hypothetical protein